MITEKYLFRLAKDAQRLGYAHRQFIAEVPESIFYETIEVLDKLGVEYFYREFDYFREFYVMILNVRFVFWTSI